MVRDLYGRGTACIGNRYYDVDVVMGKIPDDFSRQLFAHAQARLVNGQVVENRVRPCKINKFKYTGRMVRLFAVRTGVQDPIVFDEDGFARLHVAQALKLQYIERDAFGGNHVIVTPVRLALAEDERPDAIWVAERNDADTDDQRHNRITTLAPPVHCFDGRVNLVGRRMTVGADLQLVGKHVEQDFGVRARIQVAPILLHEQIREFIVIGQVAVVTKANTVRRVDIERLRLGRSGTAGGRITDMADTDLAR